MTLKEWWNAASVEERIAFLTKHMYGERADDIKRWAERSYKDLLTPGGVSHTVVVNLQHRLDETHK